MAAGGAEEHFAKKLAHNEKKVRDRAVNKLRAWIKSRPKDGPGFGEVDLLKVWKGLFYCMWMSDKPLIQEELALNISQLVLSFRNEQSEPLGFLVSGWSLGETKRLWVHTTQLHTTKVSNVKGVYSPGDEEKDVSTLLKDTVLSPVVDSGSILFIKTFFKTIQREWHGIDRLRLDKFYLLIRFFVKETFNFLKKSGWDERLVTEVSRIFQEEPLNPSRQAAPDGIRLHLVSVYLAELGSVADGQVHSDVLLELLDPLFLLAAHSNNKTVTTAVKKNLFEHLVHNDTEVSDEKQDTIMAKVDFAAVADRLFTLASDRNILGRNRNQLFDWAKRLRKFSKGEQDVGQAVQQEEHLNGLSVGSKRKTSPCKTSDITNCNTTEDDDGKESQSGEGKTKRKRNKHVEVETVLENRAKGDHESTEEKKEAKRKRKINKEENLGNASSLGEQGTLEEVKTEPKKKKKKTKIVSDSNDKTTTSKKSGNSEHKDNVEDSGIVNGSHEDDDELLASEIVPQTNKLRTNGSSINDTSVVHGNARSSLEKAELALASTAEKKVLRKVTSPNSEPFAQFQKSTTPLAFVRRCLPKTPRSEPQRSKAGKEKDQTPGSVPAKGTRKRVRIEVSKNTTHTTQDYHRSLKESPKIPFDANRTPTQGLLKSPPNQASLKSPPKLRRTPLHIKKRASFTDSGQSRTAQRRKAVDFF